MASCPTPPHGRDTQRAHGKSGPYTRATVCPLGMNCHKGLIFDYCLKKQPTLFLCDKQLTENKKNYSHDITNVICVYCLIYSNSLPVLQGPDMSHPLTVDTFTQKDELHR